MNATTIATYRTTNDGSLETFDPETMELSYSGDSPQYEISRIPGNEVFALKYVSAWTKATEDEQAECIGWTYTGVNGPLAYDDLEADLRDYDYTDEDADWANRQEWQILRSSVQNGYTDVPAELLDYKG